MIRAAMVGLGWWGRHIIGLLEDSESIRIDRATSRTPQKHADFAAETGILLVDSFEQVLADPGVDAVILCTPHSQHEEQVLKAIAVGKQVFCEKPLALKKSGAERMVAAAREAGMVLGIGHERRFERAMDEIIALTTTGGLGRLMHVEANFSHDIMTTLPADDWRSSEAEAPAAGMTGMGVHLTDLFIAMFGPVASVCAQTARRALELETGDVVTVQFKFESGATGFLSAISATPYYGRFTAFGDRMWAEARDEGHPQHGGVTHLVTCGKAGKVATRTFEPHNPVLANLEEWADAVEGRGAYRFTEAELIANIAVLEAVAKSVTSGGWVEV